MAFSRLRNTEKRLNRQYLLGEDYQNVIASYPEKEPQCQWYLPHLSVCRPERSITKTRTVFDNSAKFQDTSLNDKIPPDPKLEADLFEGLVLFRRFQVAIACDVSEMYLQINISPLDRSMFGFLRRNLEVNRNPDENDFVFGDASASLRAQFVSQETPRNNRENLPYASETVQKSTYICRYNSLTVQSICSKNFKICGVKQERRLVYS